VIGNPRAASPFAEKPTGLGGFDFESARVPGNHGGMAAFGALGLVLGLWVVLAQQGGQRRQRDGIPVALGWVLLALSALLVITAGGPEDLTGLTSASDSSTLSGPATVDG
jgi:hypothetical protein